ncbi:MAG TPA: siroheme synthase, partial [Firmicutes bacterium]|nr:siroheme synthase [Bacillota bacterium]
MDYYPMMVDLRNRPCTVVGGGAVAARKVAALLACGASVTV